MGKDLGIGIGEDTTKDVNSNLGFNTRRLMKIGD